MKKILLALLALSLGIVFEVDLRAEKKSYLPILEIGKEWTYINYAVSGELHEPAKPFRKKALEKIEEDGHEVYLLYHASSDRDYDNSKHFTKYYEEDGALWWYSHEVGGYEILIDFNLEVGDEIDSEEVVWKGYVMVEGVERLVIALRSRGSGDYYYWCEGIGAIDDVYLSPVVMHLGERTRMTECRMGDTCLFDGNRMDTYMSEVKQLVSEQTEDAAYDILGRRITKPAPGQLYIRNGKKYIGK